MATAPSLAGSDIYLTDDLLADEERAVRDRVRRFGDEEVRPVINGYWERAEFPFELIPKLAALGVCGGTIEGYGCPGLSPLAAGLVSMELARADGSVSTFHGVHSGLAMGAIGQLGSEEQKARWLPGMASLEAVGAFALTEPEHGSDAVTLETRVRRLGDGYVIDGAKRWIGNATFADLTVVWAGDGSGDVGAYVVEKGTPGVEARLITGKVAKRASWQADLTLRDVRVPAENRLEAAVELRGCGAGARRRAARHRLGRPRPRRRRLRGGGRVHARARAVRIADRRLPAHPVPAGEDARRDHRHAPDLHAPRGAGGAGELTPAMASLAKMHNAARARAVVAEARDLLGGNGLLLQHDVARHLGDVEAVSTVEGTDVVHALIVGREITGISAFS